MAAPPAQGRRRRRGAERWRGARALLLSLAVHALLLSLAAGEGGGLPGLTLPWLERRTSAPRLQVVLAPETRVPALTPAEIDDPQIVEPEVDVTPQRPVSPTPAPRVRSVRASAAIAAVPEPGLQASPSAQGAEAPAEPATDLAAQTAAETAAGTTARRVAAADESAVVRSVERARIALSAAGVESPSVSAELPAAVAPTLSASGPAGVQRLRDTSEVTRLRSPRTQPARPLDLGDLERDRRELQQQSQRLEAEQAAARQEAARQEATRQEVARQEAARQEAARQEAARQESARQDAARRDAELRQAKLQEAARAEAAKAEAARAAEERREAVLRAIGQQLNDEAAKRERAAGNLRRARLFGRADANAELVLYAEAWARKIQLNPTLEMVREAAQQPHTDPLVNVAVRSDGSVESVTFVRGSGVPALDDAIRRVIASQERYAPFSSALARDYDVIEIRRTWQFDTAIRLY